MVLVRWNCARYASGRKPYDTGDTMKLLRVLALGTVLTALGLHGVDAVACSLTPLASKFEQPLSRLQSKEIPVAETKYTESAVWRIFFERSGGVHLIRRSDYGEL